MAETCREVNLTENAQTTGVTSEASTYIWEIACDFHADHYGLRMGAPEGANSGLEASPIKT
jgi:hypothetical protein